MTYSLVEQVWEEYDSEEKISTVENVSSQVRPGIIVIRLTGVHVLQKHG